MEDQQRAHADLTHAQHDDERATRTHAAASAASATARSEADGAAGVARGAHDAAARALAARESVTAAAQAAGEALRRAQSAASAIAELAAATATATQLAKTSAAADSALDAATATEESTRVDTVAAETVARAHAHAQVGAQAAGRAALNAQADHRVAEEQVNSATRHRDAEDAKVRRRATTAADFETKTAVREALESFRRDRVARLAPEVSEVATDLVAQMTNGRYVAVDLDEEFAAMVTDDVGRQRSVAWLSGGEESVVSFALRVALGDLYSGYAGGLLVADEPFTAQDAARRQAMMGAMRSLNGRQVLLINHASEATDMVDLVLDVVPDDDNGSTVTPSASYGSKVDLDAVLAG